MNSTGSFWVEHGDDFKDVPGLQRLLEQLQHVLENPFKLQRADGSCDGAEIWIYCHALADVHFSAADIAALPFPSAVHTVLLLRPYTLRALNSSSLDRLHDGRVRVLALDPVRGIWSALETLLRTPPDRSDIKPRLSVTNTGLRDLAQAALGVDWDTEIGSILRHVAAMKGIADSDRFEQFIIARLHQNSDRGLREALLLLTNDAAASKHDARASIDRPFCESPAGLPLDKQLQANRFLEFCADLREALATPKGRFGKIVIFDDHPDTDFEANYKAVAEHLLGDRSTIPPPVNPLDPQGEGAVDDALFQFLVGYQTLRSSNTPPNVEKELLRLIGADVRYILVDQLFKTKGKKWGEFRGAELIRGLIRWLNDNRHKFEGPGGALPEVIALSRTDEPRIIQAAVRAGAKDYVLKSRFTSLPAVMERVRRGTADAANPLHQNFRTLYSLPNETIGLLQDALIPPIKFHIRGRCEGDLGRREVYEKWSSLLTGLPKADLHVHAGSVMSREFLALASLVMLLRHPVRAPDARDTNDWPNPETTLAPLVRIFHRAIDSNAAKVIITPRETSALGSSSPMVLTVEPQKDGPETRVAGENWFVGWGRAAKRKLGSRLEFLEGDSRDYRQFRAYLHRELGIRDYLSGAEADKKLHSKNDLEVTTYLLRHCQTASFEDPIAPESLSLDVAKWRYEDFVRVYILVLASRYTRHGEGQSAHIFVASGDSAPHDLLSLFRNPPIDCSEHSDVWEALRTALFGTDEPSDGTADGPFAGLRVRAFEARGWALGGNWCNDSREPLLRVELPWEPQSAEDAGPIEFREDPIGYTLATGTRSTNLAEYLLGCEFSGAEHLRHPFLMHVYSQQVLTDWVRHGVLYAELKASPDGFAYPEIAFDYAAVVQCLVRTFSDAQAEVLKVYETAGVKTTPVTSPQWAGGVLGPRYSLERLRTLMRGAGDVDTAASGHGNSSVGRSTAPSRFPCKTSLIFVGKRHKSLREMILEAAGAAVMRPAGDKPAQSARLFVNSEFKRCRVVGFDLAGQEDGYPPIEYAEEFGRLSRLHVPITVHAGENAPPQFIEDAIIELGAARIGHGLSLAEDRRLLARLRDERIAIELCPVCNHQTSQFHDPSLPSGDVGPQRRYPLADYLKNGLHVTINTDNPIISDTNMVREFFQASWAYFDGRREGLSLWDALRIIRMGFVCCFLNLEERRYMLELVGQYLFDFFSEKDTVGVLRDLADKRALREPA